MSKRQAEEKKTSKKKEKKSKKNSTQCQKNNEELTSFTQVKLNAGRTTNRRLWGFLCQGCFTCCPALPVLSLLNMNSRCEWLQKMTVAAAWMLKLVYLSKLSLLVEPGESTWKDATFWLDERPGWKSAMERTNARQLNLSLPTSWMISDCTKVCAYLFCDAWGRWLSRRMVNGCFTLRKLNISPRCRLPGSGKVVLWSAAVGNECERKQKIRRVRVRTV